MVVERKILKIRSDIFALDNFIRKKLNDVPVKEITLNKTPTGERVTIYTSAPGLVIGREGSNIKKLTKALKEDFKLKNPQVKIGEVKVSHLSAKIVAKLIANDLARFGSQKFKLTAFKNLMWIMNAGAMGAEIRITGKIPSSRSKSWRFHKGYLKKTGYVSDFLVDKAVESVTLKSGVVGIKVDIMLPDTPLPDKIKFIENSTVEETIETQEKEKLEEGVEETQEEVKE